jgi:hypothetical protein
MRLNDMKNTLKRLLLAVSMAVMGVSCSTVYDSYGRPHTVVEPEGAILGAAAVGLLAYGLASSNDCDYGYHGHYHGRRGCYY